MHNKSWTSVVVVLLLGALLALQGGFLRQVSAEASASEVAGETAATIASEGSTAIVAASQTPVEDRTLLASVGDGGWYYLLQYFDFCDHQYRDLYWGFNADVAKLSARSSPRIYVGSEDAVSNFTFFGKLYITKCYRFYYCIFLVFEGHKYFVIGNGYTSFNKWNFGSGSNRVKFKKYNGLLRTGSRYLVYLQNDRPCHSNSFFAGLKNKKRWALRVHFDYEYEWFDMVKRG